MMKALLAIAIALALPGAAQAGLVTMVAREVPLGPRALLAAETPMRFNMLGVHWEGAGGVAFRTRSAAGRWSSWLAADDDSGPDPGSRESHSRWRDGNLDWVGASVGIQFRTSGSVSRLRAYYLWSRVTSIARRTVAVAGLPAIVPRSAWFADEKIVRAKPLIAPVLKLAIVHHTDSSNSYTPAQAAAIVRGIEVYHVQGNGWNDIGYNFLIDRFGTVYEGRGGGIDKNVIGAHSLGFNTGTVGVALLGNFVSATPPPAMQSALVSLLSWRLDVGHVDPLSKVVYTSGGNAKFRAGKVLTLRAISGHRDTGPTDCPGKTAYALLPGLATRVSLTGLPKLYSPLVTGAPGGTVRFQARLSSKLPWAVTVSAASGAVVAEGKGTGPVVDWTWHAAAASKGRYTWTIGAGPSVLPASGTLGTGKVVVTPTPVPAPATPVASSNPLTALTVTPAVLGPSSDGTGGYVTVDFTLGAAATVAVKLTSVVPGAAVPLSLLAASLAAGDNSFVWDLAAVPDGRYQIVVTAKPPGGATTTQTVPVTLNRMLTGYSASPAIVSPNGDGTNDTTTFGFTLDQTVPVQLLIERLGAVVGTIFTGTLGPGPQAVAWNGTVNGAVVPDGSYTVVAVVTAPQGAGPFSIPITVDATPPSLTLLDAPTLRFQLSEPATVSVVVNDQTIVSPEPAGVFTIPWQGGPVTSISALADDAAGNLSAPLKSP